MDGTFNINNIKTNKNQIITYTPSNNTPYRYTLYKDGTIIDNQIIKGPKSTYLTKTGTYQITITINDKIISSGNYIIDKEKPEIKAKNTIIFQKNKVKLNYTAHDNIDGDITNKVTYNKNALNEIGDKTIKLTVSDEAGNIEEKYINVKVRPEQSIMIFLQIISFIIIFAIFYSILNFIRIARISNRIDPYVLNPVKTDKPSLFDNIYNSYHKLLNKIIKHFTPFMKTYAKKKDKYVPVSNLYTTGEEITAGKITFSILLTIIYIISKAILFKKITYEDIILPLIIGFYILDIVYFIKRKFYKNKIENDFLSAIIVMNNAFKANNSIYQAIDSVSKEVDGKIGKEFSKIKLELSYGLSVDEVFERFSRRINLPEAKYLTASISILNKTGGDIISVFDFIETSLFNKKKLRLELKAMTGASKILLYTLFIVPLAFIMIISIISPGYFEPFISTSIGRILLFIMILCYTLFIVCIRKILKVEI